MEYVAAAMAVIGAISSFTGAKKAKSAAEREAAEQARLEGIVTDARLEQLDTEQRTLEGQTKGRAAGSNVKVGTGSVMSVLTEQARNFANERRTVKEAGATRAAQAIERGKNVGTQAMYQGYAQAAGSASNAFSLFAQARARGT